VARLFTVKLTNRGLIPLTLTNNIFVLIVFHFNLELPRIPSLCAVEETKEAVARIGLISSALTHDVESFSERVAA
jgi:hypothetical protein